MALPIYLTNEREFAQYLTKLAYPNKSSSLIVKNGKLDNAGKITVAFEKIKGVWGQDGTNKALVELEVIRLITEAEKLKFIDKKEQIGLIEKLAERVGLNKDTKEQHKELNGLIESVKIAHLKQKPFIANDSYIRQFEKNHQSELPHSSRKAENRPSTEKELDFDSPGRTVVIPKQKAEKQDKEPRANVIENPSNVVSLLNDRQEVSEKDKDAEEDTKQNDDAKREEKKTATVPKQLIPAQKPAKDSPIINPTQTTSYQQNFIIKPLEKKKISENPSQKEIRESKDNQLDKEEETANQPFAPIISEPIATSTQEEIEMLPTSPPKEITTKKADTGNTGFYSTAAKVALVTTGVITVIGTGIALYNHMFTEEETAPYGQLVTTNYLTSEQEVERVNTLALQKEIDQLWDQWIAKRIVSSFERYDNTTYLGGAILSTVSALAGFAINKFSELIGNTKVEELDDEEVSADEEMSDEKISGDKKELNNKKLLKNLIKELESDIAKLDNGEIEFDQGAYNRLNELILEAKQLKTLDKRLKGGIKDIKRHHWNLFRELPVPPPPPRDLDPIPVEEPTEVRPLPFLNGEKFSITFLDDAYLSTEGDPFFKDMSEEKLADFGVGTKKNYHPLYENISLNHHPLYPTKELLVAVELSSDSHKFTGYLPATFLLYTLESQEPIQIGYRDGNQELSLELTLNRNEKETERILEKLINKFYQKYETGVNCEGREFGARLAKFYKQTQDDAEFESIYIDPRSHLRIMRSLSQNVEPDQTEMSDSAKNATIELFIKLILNTDFRVFPPDDETEYSPDLALEYLKEDGPILFSDNDELKLAEEHKFSLQNAKDKVILSTYQEGDQTILLAFELRALELNDGIINPTYPLSKWIINSKISLDGIQSRFEGNKLIISVKHQRIQPKQERPLPSIPNKKDNEKPIEKEKQTQTTTKSLEDLIQERKKTLSKVKEIKQDEKTKSLLPNKAKDRSKIEEEDKKAIKRAAKIEKKTKKITEKKKARQLEETQREEERLKALSPEQREIERQKKEKANSQGDVLKSLLAEINKTSSSKRKKMEEEATKRAAKIEKKTKKIAKKKKDRQLEETRKQKEEETREKERLKALTPEQQEIERQRKEKANSRVNNSKSLFKELEERGRSIREKMEEEATERAIEVEKTTKEIGARKEAQRLKLLRKQEEAKKREDDRINALSPEQREIEKEEKKKAEDQISGTFLINKLEERRKGLIETLEELENSSSDSKPLDSRHWDDDFQIFGNSQTDESSPIIYITDRLSDYLKKSESLVTELNKLEENIIKAATQEGKIIYANKTEEFIERVEKLNSQIEEFVKIYEEQLTQHFTEKLMDVENIFNNKNKKLKNIKKLKTEKEKRKIQVLTKELEVLQTEIEKRKTTVNDISEQLRKIKVFNNESNNLINLANKISTTYNPTQQKLKNTSDVLFEKMKQDEDSSSESDNWSDTSDREY